MIAGAILFALIVVFGIRFIGEVVDERVTPHSAHVAEAMSKSGAQSSGAQAPEAAAQPSADLGQRLASANAEAGKAAAKKCAACHTFDPGGPNKVGPNLAGVVGRPVASHPDFAYSDSLKKLGGEWTPERIDVFIAKPQAYAPGTKMSYGGDSDGKDRADIIAYLSSLPPGAAKP